MSYLLQLLLHHLKACAVSETKKDYTFKLKDCFPYLICVCCIGALVMLDINAIIRWTIASTLGIYEMVRMVKRKGIF